MTEDKKLLRKQAAKLYTLGVAVENERSKLKSLVNRGVAYDDPYMLAVLERFTQADTEWKQLEAEHLALRQKINKDR
ncbi:MAG: hypothetical protein FWC90_01195 [Oscillospiraceae bacterium]|nr:hypothetical protein [Oscillospiraceae bacterium]